MSRVYLHSKNEKNSLNKLFLLLFVPFIIFGFYKNGIKLYTSDYISLLGMFRPIILLLISLFVTYIFSKISKEEFLGYRLISNVLISLVVMPQVNIIIYILLICLLNIVVKYVNIIPIFMIINIIYMYLTKGSMFLNCYEASVIHNYSALDYFLGKGYGGISNTLLLFSIISFILLILNINYKKQIPIMGFIMYYSLIIIYTFATSNANIELLLNNNVIFAFIFISTLSIYTPYSKGACYIYGFLLGLLTFIFSFININLGVYISILLLGCISKLLDRFIVGKSNNNLIDVL